MDKPLYNEMILTSMNASEFVDTIRQVVSEQVKKSIEEQLNNKKKEVLLKSGECAKLLMVSRATWQKIRKTALEKGLLNPVDLGNGIIRYKESAVLALNHKSHVQ